jgi:ElaB/YqjD/DUF883 family membrane-anchored ribosome-binding protein
MNTDLHPLDSTRKMANDALERASSAVSNLRSGVQGAASRSMSAMSDRASMAQRYVGDYASMGRQYVAENPLRTALIAAAVGAAVAGLVIALRHRRDSDRYF